MWVVRANEDALLNVFKDSNCVAIGLDVPDLSNKTKEDIKLILSDKYSDSNEVSLGKNPNQVIKFVDSFEIGDYLIITVRDDNYLVGKIASDYYYSNKLSEETDIAYESYCHIRDIDWIGETKYSNLKESTRRNLRSPMSIFKLNSGNKNDILFKMNWDKIEWTDFYMELADKFLEYKDNRKILIDKIKKVFFDLEINLPTLEQDENEHSIDPYDIDPFTIFSLFNKGISAEKRISIVNQIKREFSIVANAPNTFHGISIVNNQRATFYYFTGKRGEADIDNLWNLFEIALNFSYNKKDDFIEVYDKIIDQLGVKWNISMALNWIRPYVFINLDANNRKILSSDKIFSDEFKDEIDSLKTQPKAIQYLKICEDCRNVVENSEKYGDFPHLSHIAYISKLNTESDENDEGIGDDVDVDENDENNSPKKYANYSPDDFLEEVYISEEDYSTLRDLLINKKNIIIQGAPGVGKTFMAKRLAYSLIGQKDSTRVMMIQFHQSYSYEDFVMGYRPSENGFKLKCGSFYIFCKDANEHPENDYYFIIDEINRGNLSKIFGELFMLIEADKRGEKNRIKLMYKDELFFIPKNVYIIGLMNTADRSISIIDYALRRRFAFFDLKPGFESDGFKEYQETLENKTFDDFVDKMKELNQKIEDDESLGEEFKIGHSYLSNIEPEEDVEEKLWYIMKYELIPLLKEYWFDEPSKVKEGSNILRSVFGND